MKKIDNIEIHPLIALDKNNKKTTYENASAFEQAEYDDKDIVAWGVYLHYEGAGLENVFDVVNEENADLARDLLMKLYNLE
jgi:hypothetical protein